MTLLKQAVLLSCLLALGGVVTAFAAHPLLVDQYAHGLLWKIEAEGRALPSNLCGTIHLADPHATNLPPPVRWGFEQTSSFMMESFFNGAGFVHMAERLYFDDGRSLKSLIGEAEFRELEAALIERRLLVDGLERKKPWAALLPMSSPPPQHGLLFLDLALLWEASLAGKPHDKLETMAEQIEVFDGMPLEAELALRERRLSAERHEDLLEAYRARATSAASCRSSTRPAPPAPPVASINCSTACSRSATAVCSNTCCPACRQATPSSPSGPDTSVANTACCACSNGSAGA
jgi:uncharacterized protein YbaP (TraB family)